MRSRIVCVLALVGVAVLGCGRSYGSNDAADRVTAAQAAALEDGLRAKPPLEAAQGQFRAALEQMADEIAALMPGTTWQVVQGGFTDCGGDYLWTRGQKAYALVAFSAAISDDNWPQAEQILKNGASRFGAKTFDATHDKPGDRHVDVKGADGVEFTLTDLVTSSLSARSDCRISQSDTPKAVPIPLG
ncbi:MAG: hypothetical protein JWR32_5328 [Mycobacterium sp.]|nr:hypothetical protein [Mycobacterium sp.]